MISVVIPTYNRGPLLKRAIDSVLAQDVPATEVIVVDDGSTDNTQEVCSQYGNLIQYVWQSNSGASVARNTGVVRARNAWVAFLDSDDHWTPVHLARMTSAIRDTNGAAQFYFCDLQLGKGESHNTLWQKINFAPPKPTSMVEDGTNWAFQGRQPMMLQCSVFQKRAWVNAGGLDARFRLMHDTDLFFRMSIGAQICAVSGVGCIQTDDDLTTVRLTTAVQSGETSYWKESAALWRGLLKQFPSLPRRYKRVAQCSLASAHWRLARTYWASKRFARGIWQIPQLVLVDPGYALSLVRHRRADLTFPIVLPEYDLSWSLGPTDAADKA
jgi:GT2 family glycosyltransferase